MADLFSATPGPWSFPCNSYGDVAPTDWSSVDPQPLQPDPAPPPFAPCYFKQSGLGGLKQAHPARCTDSLDQPETRYLSRSVTATTAWTVLRACFLSAHCTVVQLSSFQFALQP